MLKLKLQYSGDLMRRTDSLEKILMLGKIEGRRRRGQQRMRWLDGITNTMDTCMCRAESLHRPPETITTLLIGYSPIQNKRFKINKMDNYIMATWCKQPIHWKRSWCWERLKAEGEEGNRGWDGCIASPIQWIWTWANPRRWWRTGKPGMLQSMGYQRGEHNLVTEQQQQQQTAAQVGPK